MGHDISGFIKGNRETEIAYISIGAFNSSKIFFLYDSLQSDEMNGGVSGAGKFKSFTQDELKMAKAKLNYMLIEDEKEVSYLVESNTKEASNVFKNVLENLLGQEITTNTGALSEQEKQLISDDINNFLDKLIATNEKVEIYFG